MSQAVAENRGTGLLPYPDGRVAGLGSAVPPNLHENTFRIVSLKIKRAWFRELLSPGLQHQL